MPNIISLPSPTPSPTGAHLFRGRKHGLLTLSGKFNVDEKNLLPRGRNKRKVRINKQKLMHQWLISPVLFHQPFKGGWREVRHCPRFPEMVLFFLATDHNNASIFLSVGPHKIPTLDNLWVASRSMIYCFFEGHMLWFIQFEFDSLNNTCVFLLKNKNEDSLFKSNSSRSNTYLVFLSIISIGKCIQCFGMLGTHVFSRTLFCQWHGD